MLTLFRLAVLIDVSAILWVVDAYSSRELYLLFPSRESAYTSSLMSLSRPS